MENDSIEDKISSMVKDFESKVITTFENTEYSNECQQITDAYKNYLLCGIRNGFINSGNLDEFIVGEIIFGHANSYAEATVILGMLPDLTINERFFLELKGNKKHKNNVIYHELSHMHITLLCRKNFVNLANWGRYLDQKMGHTNSEFSSQCDKIITFFNEFLTQETAERFSTEIDGSERKKHKFESKIFTADLECESDFQTYEDYQELFLSFARTLNGFGNLEDAKIYENFKKMVEEGTISNHIIGTYQEQNRELELMNIFALLNNVKKAHASAMGIDVFYSGDKDALTAEVNNMLEYLQSIKNMDDFKKYHVEEYPSQPNRVVKLSFGKSKLTGVTTEQIQNTMSSADVSKKAEAQRRISADIISERTNVTGIEFQES